MRDFRHLDAWKKAHQLALAIYRLTESFPKSESFGLVITLRRVAASIPMKIAEASGRDDTSTYVDGLRQGRSFCTDIEYQVLLARDLGIIPEEIFRDLTDRIVEVRRMLSGVIRHNTQQANT